MTAYDLLVVGGGVQGLWVAREAVAAGLSTVLVDAKLIGGGASGGLLGALMPHVPVGWSEKKQLQFEALVELEELVGQLEDETGLATGYNRCGRIMPIRTPRFLEQARVRAGASGDAWTSARRQFEMELLAPRAHGDWIAEDLAPYGLLWDTLAARIAPRQYMSALKASIAGRCEIIEGWSFREFDLADGRANSLSSSDRIVAGRVVLAAGHATYSLLEALTGTCLGGGIKGQALLLAARLPGTRPIIYDDGLYIVPHDGDLCAIGSTTEKVWSEANTTDARIEALLARAKELCPAIRDAEIVERWAGLRPKSLARDPIVGRLAPESPIYVATGGYKITLGIAHRVARDLVEAIRRDGEPEELPASFAPAHHLAEEQLKPAGVPRP